MADRDSSLFLKAPAHRQRGQALLVLLMILVIAGSAVFYSFAGSANSAIERDKITAAALAQAKEALIGYAVGIDLLQAGAPRPGDLPCPDITNNGVAGGSCSNAGGTSLGRLPWKTLGLPDLRDGDGERLWYAVSSNFKNNPSTACASPGDPGCLNSDARGTITVRDKTGTVIYNGDDARGSFNPSGVIAVIIAPGRALQRQGAAALQDRSCTVGVNCDADERCTTSPPTLTPKCNPVNYLDILSGEDNADFVESGNITNGFTGSSANGFIRGDVFDTSGNVTFNDRIITITYADLMPLLERRVAKEILNCLNAYASVPQNNGRYPWAARFSDWPSYADRADTRFGRVPDTLNNTQLGLAGGVADTICPPLATCMASSWPASCTITSGTWWTNWKEMVFYGIADAYKPADPLTGLTGVSPGGPCGNCLEVDPPNSNNDKRVVVIVAGKRLAGVSGGQARSSTGDKSDPSKYVEGENDGGNNQDKYTQMPASSSFNDVLLYQQ